MSKITRANAQHKDMWNAFVNKHENATPYHLWGWLQSVEQAYGYQYVAWIALDDNEQVIGVLPAILVTRPIGSKVLSALPYCDAGGVLANQSDVKKALLDKALEFASEHSIAGFEHRLTKSLDENSELEAEAKVRMLLPLPETSEELLASFKSKLRSQIRKAEKNGLTATTGTDQKHLDGFYQVYARNMRDLGSPAHSKKWFESIVDNYGTDFVIANVWYEDVCVGAGLVLYNGDKCSIPWASTNADYNRLAPNMLLYWTLLEFSNDRGCTEFDFGRSTPGEGTYKFKAQWGAKPSGLEWQSYHSGELVPVENSSGPSKARELVENVWRKLPVPLASMLGGRLRKYITL